MTFKYSLVSVGILVLQRHMAITYVANALFRVCAGVGDYTLPLDHSVLVRSDICHLGCHGDMWDYVFRLGSLIGLRIMARFEWRDVWKRDMILGELSYRFWTGSTIFIYI